MTAATRASRRSPMARRRIGWTSTCPPARKPGSNLPAVVLALGVHPAPHRRSAHRQTRDCDCARRRGRRRARTRPHCASCASRRRSRATWPMPRWRSPHVQRSMARASALPGSSAGASMALDAAADPRLAGHLDFVSVVRWLRRRADRLLVDVASRTTQNADGTVCPWQPDAGIRHDVLELAIQALPDDGQRDLLRNTLRAGRGDLTSRGDRSSSIWPSPSRATHSTSSSCSRRATEQRPSRPPTRSARSCSAQLAGISPTTLCSRRSTCPVYLLHGVTDNGYSCSSTRRCCGVHLASNVKRLTEFGRFGHGQPGANGLTLGRWRRPR